MESREQRNAWCRAYYARNREQMVLRSRTYRAENPEKVATAEKKHYAANREKMAAKNKAYQIKNREKLAALNKIYRAKNRESLLARRRSAGLALRGYTVKEIVIEKYLCAAIETRGGFCPKFVDASGRGAPDRLVILPGHPVYFIELKRPNFGRLAPWQKRYHERLRACGQKVWILRSIEEVDGFLLTL